MRLLVRSKRRTTFEPLHMCGILGQEGISINKDTYCDIVVMWDGGMILVVFNNKDTKCASGDIS